MVFNCNIHVNAFGSFFAFDSQVSRSKVKVKDHVSLSNLVQWITLERFAR